ncbi:outer surface protein VlsE, partial [Borreliella burgdorferi]
KIGNVAANNNAAADKDSVNGIAKGMKGIVDAADGGKELKGGDGGGAAANANGDAGHLFAGNGAGGATAAQAGKAAAAVNAVSGEQILKAIVDAAEGEQQGAAANEATNPISAAIGTAGAGANFAAMNGNDKIAAAIVLRGMAKNGKFAVQNANGAQDSVKSAVDKAIEEISKKLKAIAEAAKAAAAVDVGEDKIGNVVTNNGGAADAGSVNGIAKGMKGIVDAADGEKELKGGDAGGANANASAGHLFAGDGANGAAAAQAGKAAAAVNAVSGEQILKAIVDAAGGEQQQGQGAGAATNPISAAIGAAEAGAAAFGDAGMNRNDKIAAAIVLRGMAKNGKFAVRAGAAADGGVKSAVDKAIEEISKKLKAIADAAKAAAAVDVGEDKIGNVANNGGAAGTADAGSVKGIAKGMKGIVDAADGGKELKGGGDAGAANAGAGHLFGDGAGATAEQAGKAAAAVNAVSGEQILKAIVDAAGDEQQQVGAAANEATNPISAAIGTAEAGANFGAMNGNDKIAAAIVLRGMAKNGKFAVQNGNGAQDSVKSAVEKAIEEISKKLKAIADAAKAAAAVDVGEEKIGNVAANNNAAADKDSVNGIAKGMKGIVDAADGGKELKG